MSARQNESRIGVNTVAPEVAGSEEYSVPVYERSLRRIKERGFTRVEYSHMAHMSDADVAEVKTITESLGLVACSIHADGNLQRRERDAFYRGFENCLRYVRMLNGNVLVFHLPYPEGVPTKEDNLEPIKGLVAMAEKEEVVIGLENGPVDLVAEIVHEIDHPLLGCVLDTGHAQRDGVDLCHALDLMGGKLVHTHLADNFGDTDDHLPPGIGLIDWRGVLKELDRRGYDGALMVELTGTGMKQKRGLSCLRNLDLELEMDVALKTLQL